MGKMGDNMQRHHQQVLGNISFRPNPTNISTPEDKLPVSIEQSPSEIRPQRRITLEGLHIY